jgi:hypothetical protein
MNSRCHYTVVGSELSFRMLTPGDRSDIGALPIVRPCPHPVVDVLVTEVDGEEDIDAPQTPVCAGHCSMAMDARAAQRERLMDWSVPVTAPHPAPKSATPTEPPIAS